MIYLNNAASSWPKPKEVLVAVQKALELPPLHATRSGFDIIEEDVIEISRKKLADFIHAPLAENIVFTSGSTESLNYIIKGIPINNCHVVTTCTEHNSVIRPLKMLEKEKKISISFVPCDKIGWVDPNDIKKNITNKTKYIIVNYTSNVTGITQDIKSISDIAHEFDCKFIVDASQAIGSFKIDIQDLDIDFMAITGHKNLFGIQGIGAIYIKSGLSLTALKYGGTGVHSNNLYQPETFPHYYESGTMNIAGIISMNEGIDFINKIGINIITEKKNRLIQLITESFKNHPNIILYGNTFHEKCTSIINFKIKSETIADTGYILESSFGIHCRTGLHCAPLIHEFIGSTSEGTVRVSPSFFTSEDDIQYFIDSINQISRYESN